MDVRHNDLKIVQWNCRSIGTPGRAVELDKSLDERKPHIACISETWLKETSKLMDFKGYKIRRKDRPGGRDGGGLFFLIKDGVKFNDYRLTTIPNSIIEAQAIELLLTGERIIILHIYNPVTTINTNHLDHLIQQLGRKFIVVGDFNGHHTIWDPDLPPNKINQCGRELSSFIIDHPNLALITTPGLKTYTHTTYQGSSSSTLDLAFCSNNLIQISETSLLKDLGSDHTPVLTTVNVIPDMTTRRLRPRWKLKAANWPQWKNTVPPQASVPDNVEDEANNFTKVLFETAKSNFRRTK